MKKDELNEYRREYNKETYKVAKVYIRKENYEEINKHWKENKYKSFSSYVNSLINADMIGGGRRVRRVKKITFYSISLANFAAPRPRATYVGAPAFPLWLAWGQDPLSMEQAEGDYSS